MERKPLRIALHPDASSQWIAGVLYVQTITQALLTVSKSDRPESHLLIRRSYDGSHYTSLRESANSIQIFDDDLGTNKLKRLEKWGRTILKNQPRPQTIEGCLRQNKADLILPCRESLGSQFNLPWIGWIPDFQHKYLPELFSTQELESRDQKFQELIDDSTHMIVSSQMAYHDLLNHYKAEPDNISVYSFRTHADRIWFDSNPLKTANKYNLPEKFLMFPSQFWQHKNHLTLLRAIAIIKERVQQDICLVLTGEDRDYRAPEHPNILKRYISEQGLDANVRYLGLLPRQDQIQLMRRACAIVQPSNFEGWSMLVEDSRALGKIVFLSDIQVHREQNFECAHYFEPTSAEALAQLLMDYWSSLKAGPDLEAEMRAREANTTLMQKSGQKLMEICRKTLAK